MPVPRLSYEDVERFYNEMKSYANEDGYCVCSPAAIVIQMGKNPGSRPHLLNFLVNSGCLKAYVSKQQRPTIKPITFYRLTENEFTMKRYKDEVRAQEYKRAEAARKSLRARRERQQ